MSQNEEGVVLKSTYCVKLEYIDTVYEKIINYVKDKENK